ncbi:hypothetical protein ACFV4N_24430 [Actinosynnema sp. NPDC059797]
MVLTAALAASGLQPIPPPAAVAAPTAVSPRDLPLLPAGTAEPDAVAPAAPAADFTPPATAEGTGGSHFDPERSRVVRFGVVEAESYKSDGCWCRDCGVQGINGLVAALYDNRHLTGSPKVYQTGLATDGTTARNWGDAAPAAGVPADNFSLRLTGDVVFPEAGNYSLRGGGAGVRQGLRSGDAGGHAGQPGGEGPGRRAAGQAPREEPHHLREQAGQGPPGPDRDQGEEHPPPRRTSPPRTGPFSRGTRGLRTGGARRTATM